MVSMSNFASRLLSDMRISNYRYNCVSMGFIHTPRHINIQTFVLTARPPSEQLSVSPRIIFSHLV